MNERLFSVKNRQQVRLTDGDSSPRSGKERKENTVKAKKQDEKLQKKQQQQGMDTIK